MSTPYVQGLLGRKGQFGFFWLAATVGSSAEKIPKSELIKLSITDACRQIASARTEPLPGSPPSSEDEEDEEEDQVSRGGKRKAVRRGPKIKRIRRDTDERIVLGLRLSANLLLGVARVYDLQVQATNNDSNQVLLDLRPMLDYGSRRGKGVGPGRLNMPDDMHAVNINAEAEQDLGHGLDFGFTFGYGDAWEDFNLDEEAGESLASVGPPRPSTQTQSLRSREEEDEDEVEQGRRAQRRATTTLGSPSSINLLEPQLYAGSERASQPPPDLGGDFEPGMDLGLNLIGEDDFMAGPQIEDFGGEVPSWGRPSSSTGLGPMEDIEMGDYDQLDLGFGEEPLVAPAEGQAPAEPQVLEGESYATETASISDNALQSILNKEAANQAAKGPKKKKATTAVIDEELIVPDEELKGWRSTYVQRMIEEGAAARRKELEKAGREQVHDLLFGMPIALNFQNPEMINFVLAQRNQRYVPEKAEQEEKKPRRPRQPAREGTALEEGEEEAERPEQVEYPQMEDYPQMDDYPPDMGGQEDFGAPGYTEFEVPIKGNETTFLEGQVMEEEDDVEVGRRGSEVSRKSSVTPWEALGRRRESSIGLGPAAGRPSSSSYAGGRLSLASDTLPGARRYQRAGSHVSSVRSGSVDRYGRLSGPIVGRESREGTALLEGYPGEEMLPHEEMLEESLSGSLASALSLARQTAGFLEYLKRLVVERPQPPPPLPVEGEEAAPAPEPDLSIPFSTIVPTDSSSASTAAKGFYQLLVLGTKDVVALKQEEPFGEIDVRLK